MRGFALPLFFGNTRTVPLPNQILKYSFNAKTDSESMEPSPLSKGQILGIRIAMIIIMCLVAVAASYLEFRQPPVVAPSPFSIKP